MKKAGFALFGIFIFFFCVSLASAATVSYGTIGTGATATQVGSAVELYTADGGVGSAYVRLEIPGGIALNTITSLSYTAKVTNFGPVYSPYGNFDPEVVINIDADNDGAEGTGINWMLSGYNPTTLNGDNFLSGDNWPISMKSPDTSFVNRDALSGYNYWSADDARTGFGSLWTSFTTIVPGMLPVHGIDPTDKVYSIDFVVGTSGNFNDMTALVSSVELNGVTYFVIPPTEVWVDDDYDETSCTAAGHTWQYDCYDNIQDGIDAVEGSIVNVAAGAYDGFKIEGKNNIIVQGSGNVEISTNPVIHTINSNDYKVFIDVTNSTNITIKGLTLDADDINGNYFRAIFYSNSNGVIEGNIIQNIDSLGQQTRGGIYVNTSEDIEILNNTLDEIGKGGIVVYYASSVQIEGNIIITTDHSIAPNGIQIGYLLDSGYPPALSILGTISSNEITGCSWEDYNNQGYDNADTGSGILIMDTTADLEVSNNEIYNCDVGMDVEAGDSTKIKHNNIYDNAYGFVLWNENPSINYNKIENNDEFGVFRTIWGSETGILNAEYNWWGSCDGPYHPTTNPDGQGDEVSDDVDYTPWLGICITNKTNVTCAFETKNVTLSANLTGLQIQDVWFSYTINNTNYNKTASHIGGNKYQAVILSNESIGGQNITWNVYANDSIKTYKNGEKTFYVRKKTRLSVNPVLPNGLNNWFVTEPTFTLTKDTNGTKTYYQWDSDDIYNYTNPFGLENIPNPPEESAGTLELNWWTDFGICGNETQQNKTFYIDLTNPLITNLKPANNSVVYNNLKPEISAYLDEVYGSNSGIDTEIVQMSLNGNPVPAIVNLTDTLDAIVTYIPTSNLNLGKHNVSVNVTDNAGRNSELTWFFYINITPVFTMQVNSPQSKIYDSKRIPFNITLSENVEKIEFINLDDKKPRWKILCRNCNEYGFIRKKTQTLKEGWNNITIKAIDYFGQVKEQNITLFIDSKKPRIHKTEPKRNRVINGSEFYIKYTEDNLENITLFYGTGTEEITKYDCPAGKSQECLFKDVDLTSYNGEWIEYWFEVSDVINTVLSKKTRVFVDTISPELTVYYPETLIDSETYGRKVPFNITVTEDVLLEYIDYSASKPRWRRLTSNSDEYGFTKAKTISFSRGPHNILIRAVDKAGNSDIVERSFEVEY